MKSKVSIVKCKSYDTKEVETSVRIAFDLLGGISSFIKKGEKVLIKPNILSGRLPEDGVNTHVEVVRSVIRLVKESRAIPLLGDNPCGSVSPKEVYISSGMKKVAEEEGAELLDVKNVKVVKGLPIASYFFECDKIISLPKMKTHSLMTLTGAIKNMYGAVAGLNKSQKHKEFPKPEEFVGILVDVFETVKPTLSLMDGIIAMDGDGPAAGDLKSANLLIASEDSVALDSVFSHLIGIKPFDIVVTEEAYKRGLGEAKIENIEIVGENIENCFIKRFKLPRSKFLKDLPEPLLKILAYFIKFKLSINKKLCKKCMICQKTCPANAITINERQSQINYHKCIRCMCCHEVCPYKAISLKRNILAKKFGI